MENQNKLPEITGYYRGEIANKKGIELAIQLKEINLAKGFKSIKGIKPMINGERQNTRPLTNEERLQLEKETAQLKAKLLNWGQRDREEVVMPKKENKVAIQPKLKEHRESNPNSRFYKFINGVYKFIGRGKGHKN